MSDKTSDKRLLPCPFCGGEAEMHNERLYIGGRSNGIERVYVQCKRCNNRTMSFDWDDKRMMLKAWNTRKPMERIVQRLERHASINDGCSPTDINFRAALNIAIEIVKEEM